MKSDSDQLPAILLTETSAVPEEVKLIIAKQRNGWAGGHVDLLFYKQWSRFEVK